MDECKDGHNHLHIIETNEQDPSKSISEEKIKIGRLYA